MPTPKRNAFTLIELLVSAPLSPWERVRSPKATRRGEVRAKRTAADDLPSKQVDNFQRSALTPALSQRERGFTLIELLVVVTIIVVLLALLVPAMEKAIYQAELAVCGAHQRGIVNGVATYAIGSKRYYPTPRIADWTPNTLVTGMFAGSIRDDRPLLRPFFDVDMLTCPPAGRVNLDHEIIRPEGTFVTTAMDFWWGWRYRHELGGPGMMKIGDRWGWDGQLFNVLVADNIAVYPGQAGAENHSAHPDDAGVFTNRVFQDSEAATQTGTGADLYYFTWAGWFGVTDWKRGRVDFNAATADGAVARYNAVHWDAAEERDRMATVPRGIGGDPTSVRYHMVPRK